MAARGTEAKKIIADKIRNALSDCYLGESDKKLFFSARENGEDVQVCISMTCPKTPIAQTVPTANLDWSGEKSVTAPIPSTEISEEDRKTVDELMRRLGISD